MIKILIYYYNKIIEQIRRYQPTCNNDIEVSYFLILANSLKCTNINILVTQLNHDFHLNSSHKRGQLSTLSRHYNKNLGQIPVSKCLLPDLMLYKKNMKNIFYQPFSKGVLLFWRSAS